MIADTLTLRFLDPQEYLPCLLAMQTFTNKRDEHTPDEIWFLEHPPVFTLGQNSKPEHILNAGNIPIIQADRGGQVTYHGPGQLMVYTLIDLKRKKFNIRNIVSTLEEAVIELLKSYQITAIAKRDAPGVYINQKKICSVGLRIRRGCSYHGLALNVDMDLTPFNRINPCGFKNLQMTQVADFLTSIDLRHLQLQLIDYLITKLRYTKSSLKVGLPNGK